MNASKEVFGKGHNGYIVNHNDKFIDVASDGLVDGYPINELALGGKHEFTIKSFDTRQEAIISANRTYDYNNMIEIIMSKDQGTAFIKESLWLLRKDYHVYYNNCATIIESGLKRAGFNISNSSFIPNDSYNAIKTFFKK